MSQKEEAILGEDLVGKWVASYLLQSNKLKAVIRNNKLNEILDE
jgi:hypothetical protein